MFVKNECMRGTVSFIKEPALLSKLFSFFFFCAKGPQRGGFF